LGDRISVTYINCYDENGKYLDRTKRIEEYIDIGYIIERSLPEGYINWEITKIMYVMDHGKYWIMDVEVKQHPYIKTLCEHEWFNWQNIPYFYRKCYKCQEFQEYNYTTCKYEESSI